ncbi:hypothetical protein GGX14DRAFT_635380 [Mycena pura]|uniref:DDE Tnp4 domain-containing protein n=1 Tax=Mycena pura TaxID=153505 RepID=A0AAD6VEJ8_9AGAR|nr:hypothetical protein GGX14DRAFT_635380 [Mycena pura]
MDTDLCLFYQLFEALEDEEDDVEEEGFRAGTILATLAVCAIEAHTLRTARRKPRRLYLCRPQLPWNPRGITPWQVLYASRNDRAFITTMGFDVATFDAILGAGFAEAWYTTPIPRDDTSNNSHARPHGRSLDAAGALGLLLHYLSSTMREVSLQQIFALIPSTVSRYITFSLQILLGVLRQLPAATIRWPERLDDYLENNELIVARHPRLTGAFATIDGVNLPCQTSRDEEIENATYNGWLSEHYVHTAFFCVSRLAQYLYRNDHWCES